MFDIEDMRILRVALLLVHAFVVSRLASGAAVDRYESERTQHTSVINLLGSRQERRIEDPVVEERPGVDLENTEEDEDYYDYYEDEDDDEEDNMSGDYEVELPRVAMSSKPKDPETFLKAETEGKRRGKGRKKGKGKGKKRNPCLRKYKDFCIHGTCQYLRDLKAPSCICHSSYSGPRCEFFALSVGRTEGGYNRTTALAVVAVVLSSLCLTIIALLLVLRFHKRGGYDVESEEKVKLGLAPNH